jgi:DNA-binding beta-propeller fold protein YncE
VPRVSGRLRCAWLLAAGVLAIGVGLVRAASPEARGWSEADVRASRTVVADVARLPARPSWHADPMNLFVVVEGGDHQVSLVDGDRFERIHRFASRPLLHGGPKFTADGRFAYFASRDGWITRYDLWNLTVVAEVRAGLDMRGVAVSADGRWVMAANHLPHSLALFDADLNLVRTYAATSADGSTGSRVSAIHDAAPRRSFVVAMRDIAELWEISYDPKAESIYDGMVHDYRFGEGIAKPGFLGVRRIVLEEPLGDFFFESTYHFVFGDTRPKAGGTATVQVVGLDIRRKVAALPVGGLPQPGSGISFAYGGGRVLASPNLQVGAIDVIDLQTWKSVATIPTPGPGSFVRSHASTPYAWADSTMSPGAQDTLTIVDKRTLRPVASVREPGRTLAHVEFTRDGRHALASLREQDGALIVYDAATFREVRRLPMRQPLGVYNVRNVITRSEGTSN